MADGYFVVPVAGSGNIDDPRHPKYAGTKGIEGFSGTEMDFSADKHSDLPWHPNKMYVVRFYGTQAALDTIAGYGDAFGKAEYDISDADVAGYLNDKMGEDRTFDQWLGSFNIG